VALLYSGATMLIIGLEFARKDNFKKKWERPIYKEYEWYLQLQETH